MLNKSLVRICRHYATHTSWKTVIFKRLLSHTKARSIVNYASPQKKYEQKGATRFVNVGRLVNMVTSSKCGTSAAAAEKWKGSKYKKNSARFE